MVYKIATTCASFLIFFILLFLYTKLAGPLPFEINSVTTTKSDIFSVTGEGVSSQKPDTASVSVGVSANGSTVKVAQDLLNQNINKVSSAIKNLGVDSKDIQTTNYNINPNVDFTIGTQKINGYQANTNLLIKVRKIDDVNKVIDVATAAGANQVGGVNFEVADQQKAENEAREKAVAEAKRKAEDASRIAGFKLGRVINYSENFGGGVPRPVLFDTVAPAEKQVPTQVEPGSSEIKVSVTLSYQIL